MLCYSYNVITISLNYRIFRIMYIYNIFVYITYIMYLYSYILLYIIYYIVIYKFYKLQIICKLHKQR